MARSFSCEWAHAVYPYITSVHVHLDENTLDIVRYIHIQREREGSTQHDKQRADVRGGEEGVFGEAKRDQAQVDKRSPAGQAQGQSA